MRHLLLAILSIICLTNVSIAQNLLRGPYLQMPTSESIKVMWRTDEPVPSRVYWSSSLDDLYSNFVEGVVPVTDHTVTITGLNPYTQYYYAIGTGGNVLAGGNEGYRFRTSPTIGTAQPVTIWAVGDFGKGNQEQADCATAYGSYVNDQLADIWLWLGDNAYQDGTDEEYQNNVFNEQTGYPQLMARLPFMPTPGNHDYNSIAPPTASVHPLEHTGAYYDIVEVPQNGEIGGVPSGNELYYSFDYANIHFVCINSELGSMLSSSNDWTGTNFGSFNGSPMLDWLHADLQANDKPWTIAFFHQPPHTDGSHYSGDIWERYMRAMRVNFCPVLEQYGVDLIINGHSHVYERSYLLNGYYGTPNQFNLSNHAVSTATGSLADNDPIIKHTTGEKAGKGTVYVVQGNSGSKTTDPGLSHPAMVRTHGCNNCVGSTLLRINGDTLFGTYLTGSGEVLDEWALIKQPEGPVDTTGTGILDAAGPVASLEIRPNPFSQEANVSFTLSSGADATVELTDMSGKRIAKLHQGQLAAGSHSFKVNSAALRLSKGTYLVRVLTGARPVAARLLKLE